MKLFKYLVTLITAISILGSLSKDVKGFIRGFKPDFGEGEHVEVRKNKVGVNKDELSLTGVYEYKTPFTNKNSYLEFKEGYLYYYGTSSDFSSANEKDTLAYFFTPVTDVVLEKNKIDFTIKVDKSMFYKYQISPLYRTDHNENLKINVPTEQRLYKGILSDDKDTIYVMSEDLITRNFVKKKL